MEENSNMATFVDLLGNLSTPDNQVRAAAEQQYEELKTHPDGYLPFSLLTVCQLPLYTWICCSGSGIFVHESRLRLHCLRSLFIQTTVTPDVPPHIRKLAAVLLRRILIQDENSAYAVLSETRYDIFVCFRE